MKRNRLNVIIGALLMGTGLAARGPVSAEEAAPVSVEDRLKALEQKQETLEKRGGAGIVPVAGKDGFALKAADNTFQIKFQGDLQADGRFYLDDTGEAFTDTFLLRRVRPTIDASVYGLVTARIQPSFGGGSTTMDDAYLEIHPWSQFRVRAGRFKAPVGIEVLQSSAKLLFIERGLPSGLAPSYDEGVQIHGDLWGGAVYYAVAVQNGALDGASADADNGDRKDFGARLFFTPLKSSPSPLLNELGFGFGAMTGKDSGTANASATRLPSYKTEGLNTFFTYRTNVIASGIRTRWSPQLSWYPGRVGLLAEYVVSAQDVKSTSTMATADLKNRAWQVAVSWVLTGERASNKGVKPRNPFDPKQKTWGAWEIAGRYSQFNADKNAFPRFADIARSPRSARAWTGALNWYMNSFMKVASNYTCTRFDGGAASGDRDTERALFSRFQFSF